MLPSQDVVLTVSEIDQHKVGFLRRNVLPSFESGLQSFALDLLEQRMRVYDLHPCQIGEGILQARAQLALDLVFECDRKRGMIGYFEHDLQAIGRVFFRIKLSGRFITKAQRAQGRKEE